MAMSDISNIEEGLERLLGHRCQVQLGGTRGKVTMVVDDDAISLTKLGKWAKALGVAPAKVTVRTEMVTSGEYRISGPTTSTHFEIEFRGVPFARWAQPKDAI